MILRFSFFKTQIEPSLLDKTSDSRRCARFAFFALFKSSFIIPPTDKSSGLSLSTHQVKNTEGCYPLRLKKREHRKTSKQGG